MIRDAVISSRTPYSASAFSLRDSIDANEAADVGLVSEIAPQDAVLETAREFAATFNEKSPVVTELVRDSFMRAQGLDYRRSIENVTETIL